MIACINVMKYMYTVDLLKLMLLNTSKRLTKFSAYSF